MAEFLIYFIISLVVLLAIYFVFTFISIKKQQRKIVHFQQELKPNMEV